MWCTFLLSPWQQLFRKCSWCVKLCQITVVCFPHDIALRCDLKYLKLKCTFISNFGNSYIFLLWHVLSSSKIGSYYRLPSQLALVLCASINFQACDALPLSIVMHVHIHLYYLCALSLWHTYTFMPPLYIKSVIYVILFQLNLPSPRTKMYVLQIQIQVYFMLYMY